MQIVNYCFEELSAIMEERNAGQVTISLEAEAFIICFFKVLRVLKGFSSLPVLEINSFIFNINSEITVTTIK